ncbi:MAG: hypothetical protein A3B81_02380 [Candidatus Muproteobacteria bacterium RIFCSPHIGHO2_02_FULL_65_16]|uniref:Thioredoxin domain-containing protein n=1 Tax=Candidatus Muproteobacteria bacterium RIFCSPHIGHO2_02_FULL_65_16 TaxID=1817766 RepID=A0A1F6TTT5_9PROT|nr:MAG: hypothetical protein A3B81_02380 [Candidatus Muproteobacteria bacterium RIFCSPHIGHO2_02_FULL_65_16]
MDFFNNLLESLMKAKDDGEFRTARAPRRASPRAARPGRPALPGLLPLCLTAALLAGAPSRAQDHAANAQSGKERAAPAQKHVAARTEDQARRQVYSPARGFDETAAMKISQGAIGRALGDYVLRDRAGRDVRLADYRGKPLIVSMVYTSCAHVCPVTTQHLKKVIGVAQEALEADSFNVITIGFDTTRDNPPAMAHFARAQGVDLPGWEFLSADAATIERLSRDLGFLHFPSPKGFDHLTQVSLIDPQGKVYLQVYGEDFKLPLLTEPLKGLVNGVQSSYPGLEGLSNRIRLFCTVYDPRNERYMKDYSFFVGLFVSIAFIILMTTIIIREARRSPPPRGRAGRQ